jgi:hypothetical protein
VISSIGWGRFGILGFGEPSFWAEYTYPHAEKRFQFWEPILCCPIRKPTTFWFVQFPLKYGVLSVNRRSKAISENKILVKPLVKEDVIWSWRLIGLWGPELYYLLSIHLGVFVSFSYKGGHLRNCELCCLRRDMKMLSGQPTFAPRVECWAFRVLKCTPRRYVREMFGCTVACNCFLCDMVSRTCGGGEESSQHYVANRSQD